MTTQYTDRLFGGPSLVSRLVSDRATISRLNTQYFDNAGQVRRRVFEGYTDLSKIYVKHGLNPIVDRISGILLSNFVPMTAPITSENVFDPKIGDESLRLTELQLQKLFVNLFNTPNLRFSFDKNLSHDKITIDIVSVPAFEINQVAEAISWVDGYFRLNIENTPVCVTIPYGYIKKLCLVALLETAKTDAYGRSAIVDSAVASKKFVADFEALTIETFYAYLNTLKEITFVDYMVTVYSKLASVFIPGQDINPIMDQLKKDPAIASGDRTVANDLAIARICVSERGGISPEDLFILCQVSSSELEKVVALITPGFTDPVDIPSIEYYKTMEGDETLVPLLYITKTLHYVIVSALTYTGGRNTMISDYFNSVSSIIDSLKIKAMSTMAKNYVTAVESYFVFWKNRWENLKNPSVLNNRTAGMVENIVYEVAI